MPIDAGSDTRIVDVDRSYDNGLDCTLFKPGAIDRIPASFTRSVRQRRCIDTLTVALLRS